MNNRNPNKENTYTNLGAWCAQYHEQSGIKIHPSSVPYDLVLEDLMGYIAILMAHDKTTVILLDNLTKRLDELEKSIHELTVTLVDLEAKTGNHTFETAAEIQERWKEENKPEPKNLNKKAKK